jgi:hypothetical protein
MVEFFLAEAFNLGSKHLALYTLAELNQVCQECAEILIVNLWRTLKAFKGKGQAVAQLVEFAGFSQFVQGFILFQRGTVFVRGGV